MALESRLNKVHFFGQDGNMPFVGQVTTDAAWREYHDLYGYRVKVRIFGKHPPSSELPDEKLPWAHVSVPCTFGAGKHHAGTTLCLQGGETVHGYFADGEDGQIPIILGAFQTEFSIRNETEYLLASNSSSKFYEMFAKPDLEWSALNQIGGVNPNETNGVNIAKNLTKQNDIDEKKIIVKKAKKCKGGKGFLHEVSRSLASFIEVTNGLNKFQDTYIDPVMDEIADVAELARTTAQVISGAYATVIRLARKYLFDKIYKLVENLMGFLQLDSLLKDIAVKKAVDSIYCVIENIIKSLQNVIEEFLIGLIGKLVQAPLCAAEQFLAGLNSRFFNDIEKKISDAMNTISGILGPIGSFMGFLDKAMNYVQIGLKLLSCEDTKCPPEPYDWALNFGPSKQQTLDFKRTIDISSKFDAVGFGKSVNDGIEKFFGLDENDLENADKVAAIVGPCPIDKKVCGAPKIEIFGGGGIGAVANAVVNEYGSIVGVNMQELGFGYTSKPFVSILDNCGGNGAEGEAIVENGQVVNIIIRRGGGGYQIPTDISDSDGISVVGEIEGVEIINTGRDYKPDDIITSECGQLKMVLDSDGRIIDARVISAHKGCKVIPALSIKTKTGYGALVRPIMRYRKVEDYDSTIPADGVMVVDCVSSY
jgi:hypothetical protein